MCINNVAAALCVISSNIVCNMYPTMYMYVSNVSVVCGNDINMANGYLICNENNDEEMKKANYVVMVMAPTANNESQWGYLVM